MKITLSVLPRNFHSTEEGPSFKKGGVKRLHIIALAPSVPEKYEFISLIWTNLLKLNELEATVAADLKTINIIVGIMAHSSSHPCPYCETSKKELVLKCGRPRTVENIREQCTKHESLQKSNECASCIHPPLICRKGDDHILDICPPPPLHITLGIVNAVFQAVQKQNPDWANLWALKAHVRHQQRAYGFTGRACHSLISTANLLQENKSLVGYFNVSICSIHIVK